MLFLVLVFETIAQKPLDLICEFMVYFVLCGKLGMYKLFLNTRQQVYLAAIAANKACRVCYAVIQKSYQIFS